MKNNSSGAISWSIGILQKHLQDDKERITDMATLTAEQRYQKFLRVKPNIIRHVPLRYIASYLGITQRHLSRLRQSDRGVARANWLLCSS